jgi:hypothetical protein
MAKQTGSTFIKKGKKRRPGVHSKKKVNNSKTSKNWKKPYRGQG